VIQDISPNARDRAQVLFGDLIEGRWEKASRELDPHLRGQVRLDQWFARAWAKAMSSIGAFERMDVPSAWRFGGYIVVNVPLAFRAGGAIGEVVFGRDGKVAALTLELPFPRPGRPQAGKRRGGVMVRDPEIEGLTRIRP
jgi:hypothetical protein